MKLKYFKNFFVVFICTLFLFTSVPHIKTFAGFYNIISDERYTSGGKYEDINNSLAEYLDDHPSDSTEYECHYLIPKDVLNAWGDYLHETGRSTINTVFLISDQNQKWAPSIIMEKSDHEQISCLQAKLYKQYMLSTIIAYGDLNGLLRKQIQYISELFRKKYDHALSQVSTYINSLNIRGGPWHGGWSFSMSHPYYPDLTISYNITTRERLAEMQWLYSLDLSQ